MKVFFDTSVLVASVVARHPHHARAAPLVRRVIEGADQGFISAHSVAESYAVLTVLPVSPRIGPEAAEKLVTENLIGHLSVVALTTREYTKLVPALAEMGAMGGATYDMVHLACARKRDVERIFTFNVAHFRRLAPDLAGRIVAP